MTEKLSGTIRAYKGFDENLCCRGFQFEVGMSYEHHGYVVMCTSGFHACERPRDVWSYYGPCTARFCLVELSGVVVGDDSSSKVAASIIKIIEEIPLAQFIQLFVLDVIDGAELRGDNSQSASSGDNSKSEAIGINTIAMVAGRLGRAKCGDNGCFALCWNNGNRNRIVVGYAGENGILPDTWYCVDQNGELVVA